MLGRSTPALTLGSGDADDDSRSLSEQPSWEDVREEQEENKADRLTLWIQNVESESKRSSLLPKAQQLTVNEYRGSRRGSPELRSFHELCTRRTRRSANRPCLPPFVIQPIWQDQQGSPQDARCSPNLHRRFRAGRLRT